MLVGAHENGDDMYENPINIFTMADQIIEDVQKSQEEYVMRYVKELGITADKDELVRALQYDRQQYEKGYLDGMHYVLTEENIVDWMAEYIKSNSIKSLMELVMKAIDKDT